jgi:hypothetical protein
MKFREILRKLTIGHEDDSREMEEIARPLREAALDILSQNVARQIMHDPVWRSGASLEECTRAVAAHVRGAIGAGAPLIVGSAEPIDLPDAVYSESCPVTR